MKTVVIAYDPADMSRVGTTVELPDDQAQLLVREGRARYAEPATAPATQVATPAGRDITEDQESADGDTASDASDTNPKVRRRSL